MESQPLAFFEKVRQGYLGLAAQEPERIAVIDASLTIEQVEAQITTLVEGRLHAL
jgi:dTMP kinase